MRIKIKPDIAVCTQCASTLVVDGDELRCESGHTLSRTSRIAGGELEEPTATRKGEEHMSTVDSTSDERTVNNVMRHAYRVLSDDEKQQMQAIKDAGLEFWNMLDGIGQSRELSLAKTKIEEAVMWAVKHITK